MTFSESGGVITQTSTDLDLSGLAGIAGVTVLGSAQKTIYSLDAVKLEIEGTLTINPRRELLHFINSPVQELTVALSGTLIIDGERPGEGAGNPNYYDTDTVIAFDRLGSSQFSSSDACFYVRGALDWRGGAISGSAVVDFTNNSTVTINNAVWNGLGHYKFQLNTSSLTLNGPFVIKGHRTTIGLALTLTDYGPEDGRGIDRGGTGDNATLINFSPLNNDTDLKLRFNCTDKIINSTLGMNTVVEPFFTGTHGQNGGVCELFRRISFECVDVAGSAIAGPKIYVPDYDDGNRVDLSGTFGGAFDYTSTLSGLVITADGSGLVAPIDILLKVWHLDSTDGSNFSLFRRAKNNNDDAIYDILGFQYGFSIATITQSLNGSPDLVISVPLLPDLLITETSKSIVDAYTEFDGANSNQRAYDACAAYLYDNYAGETETIATLTDGVFDARALDVVIDATAVAVVDLTGATLTLKASTWTGDITTTGTVSTVNGAVIDGVVTDANGTRYPAVDFTDFPVGNNANGVAYNCVLAIRNENDATLFTADASSGTVSQVLGQIGDGVGPFTVWADGIGLVRSNEFSIDVTRRDDFSFQGLLEEFLAEDGTPIIGLSAPESGLSYDQANTRFELAPGSYTFHGLAHQKEVLTSSQAGQAFDNAAVRAIEFIQNDSYKRVLLPSPFLVSSTESAATSPIITDCVIIRADGADPYTHGLSSTASGLTERPEVRIAFQAPPSSAVISSIATDAITADAIATDAVTEIQSGLVTSAAVPSIPTNPLLTTDSRLDNLDAAISTRSSHSAPDLSNLDVAVSTRSSHAAPDLSGLSTFNAASDQVIVATNNDKTGYALAQAFPTNFSSLGINSSGHISRVTLTDTTTTNTDMRGTDGANTTAPDNASIADILVDTGTTIPNLLADIPTVSEFEARTLPAADYFDPSADTVARVTLVDTTTANTDMRGTDSALTALPTIPSNWLTADGIASDAVTEIQSGLGTSTNQSTIIANIAALNDSDATAANQTSILTLVTDLHQFKGADEDHPLSVNTRTNEATVNGKTLTQTTSGDIVTTTRT